MSIIKKILTHEFVKNSSIIIIGSLIAQVINLGSPIIISRLFTPEHFGELALLTSIVAILGNVASFKFESAISVSENNYHAARLLSYCFNLIRKNIFILFLIAFVIYFSGFNFFQNPQHIFFIPAWIAIYAYYFSIKAYLIKVGEFKFVSINSILKSTFNITMQTLAGLMSSTATSLISGKVISEFLATLSFFNKKVIQNYRDDLQKTNQKEIYHQYKKIAYWHIPIRLIDSLSKNSIIFIMTYFFSNGVVGLLSLAEKLIQLPANLIAENVQRVFEQRSVRYFNNPTDLRSYVLKVALLLFGISTIPFILLFFFNDYFINFLLPKNWQQTTEYIKWLSPLIVGRFVLVPFYSIFKIKQKLNQLLIIQSIELTLKSTILVYIGLNYSPIIFTQTYVVVSLFFMLIAILKGFLILNSYTKILNPKR